MNWNVVFWSASWLFLYTSMLVAGELASYFFIVSWDTVQAFDSS